MCICGIHMGCGQHLILFDCEARKLGHSISKVVTRLGFFSNISSKENEWDHKQMIRRSLHHIESQFNACAAQPINECIVQCKLHALELFNCWPPLTPQQWLLHFTWDRTFLLNLGRLVLSLGHVSITFR